MNKASWSQDGVDRPSWLLALSIHPVATLILSLCADSTSDYAFYWGYDPASEVLFNLIVAQVVVLGVWLVMGQSRIVVRVLVSCALLLMELIVTMAARFSESQAALIAMAMLTVVIFAVLARGVGISVERAAGQERLSMVGRFRFSIRDILLTLVIVAFELLAWRLCAKAISSDVLLLFSLSFVLFAVLGTMSTWAALGNGYLLGRACILLVTSALCGAAVSLLQGGGALVFISGFVMQVVIEWLSLLTLRGRGYRLNMAVARE